MTQGGLKQVRRLRKKSSIGIVVGIRHSRQILEMRMGIFGMSDAKDKIPLSFKTPGQKETEDARQEAQHEIQEVPGTVGDRRKPTRKPYRVKPPRSRMVHIRDLKLCGPWPDQFLPGQAYQFVGCINRGEAVPSPGKTFTFDSPDAERLFAVDGYSLGPKGCNPRGVKITGRLLSISAVVKPLPKIGQEKNDTDWRDQKIANLENEATDNGAALDSVQQELKAARQERDQAKEHSKRCALYLQHQVEKLQADLDSAKTIRATYEKQIEDGHEYARILKGEIEELKAQLAAAKTQTTDKIIAAEEEANAEIECAAARARAALHHFSMGHRWSAAREAEKETWRRVAAAVLKIGRP